MTETNQGTLLIVDDTPTNLKVLADYLVEAGFEILVATDGEGALERLNHVDADLILLDVMMPGMDGFETCEKLKKNPDTRDIPVVFMTALTETDDKVKGFEAGAVDYVTKPIHQEEVLARVHTQMALRKLQINLEEQVMARTGELQNALQEVEQLKSRLEAENLYLQEEIKQDHNFEEIITQNSGMKALLDQVAQVAPTDATVLILGETGTGKELLARAVHNTSGRKDRTLVKVNCAALPINLIESELFGHEKGAFTGAEERKIGRFELADGGTIFLDEIGDLPLELQAKLLRVLQEGEFERLGSSETLKVDVRVIAATNRDLEEEVKDNTFREDLFYRLNVFPVRSLPLREHTEDIPLLVTYFVKKFATRIGKQVDSVPQKAMDTLQTYPWPGNVRELENIIERAVIVSRGNKLELGDWFSKEVTLPDKVGPVTLEENERRHILEALAQHNWRVSGDKGAAKTLDINPHTLLSRMEKLGIKKSA
jgi:formate hydrogenlyase transcriptional activator